jgi:catechol 2,3-dioxygenase-like lactoylglutathione lyase family enzyme
LKLLDKLRAKKGFIKGLDHAAIIVKDMDRSIRFYSEILDLEIQHDGRGEGGDKKSFLGTKDKSLIALTENQSKKPGEHRDRSVSHIAFEVTDIEKAKTNLESKGVEFIEIKKNSKGDPVAYHFLDPDGFELEIYNDTEKVAPY